MSGHGDRCARPALGMRVHVFDGARTEDLGFGWIVRVRAGVPMIMLDSGRRIHGSECWWHLVVPGLTPRVSAP